MEKQEKRFSKLNRTLGYGNAQGRIVFIGIEESRPWTLQNIIEDSLISGKEVIRENLNTIGEKSIADQINIIKDQFDIDIEELADCRIDDISSRIIYELEPTRNLRDLGRNTTTVQCFLSFELLKLLGDSVTKEGLQSYMNIFGTRIGNEMCLNFYPIARKETRESYPEEDFLFRTNHLKKFYGSYYQKTRIDQFKLLFQTLKNRMLEEDIFIFILGNDPYNNLNQVCGEVFEFDFGKNDNSGKFRLPNDRMIANEQRNIWSVAHPAYNHLSNDDVSKIIIPEISKRFSTRQ